MKPVAHESSGGSRQTHAIEVVFRDEADLQRDVFDLEQANLRTDVTATESRPMRRDDRSGLDEGARLEPRRPPMRHSMDAWTTRFRTRRPGRRARCAAPPGECECLPRPRVARR